MYFIWNFFPTISVDWDFLFHVQFWVSSKKDGKKECGTEEKKRIGWRWRWWGRKEGLFVNYKWREIKDTLLLLLTWEMKSRQVLQRQESSLPLSQVLRTHWQQQILQKGISLGGRDLQWNYCVFVSYPCSLSLPWQSMRFQHFFGFIKDILIFLSLPWQSIRFQHFFDFIKDILIYGCGRSHDKYYKYLSIIKDISYFGFFFNHTSYKFVWNIYIGVLLFKKFIMRHIKWNHNYEIF